MAARLQQVFLSNGNHRRQDLTIEMGEKGTWHCLVRSFGGRFQITMDGFAPRFLRGVIADKVVTLYRPHELLVKIKGLPKGKELTNLIVQADPVSGFEGWEWSLLSPSSRSKRRLQTNKAPGGNSRMVVTYCFSSVRADGSCVLQLTKPGTWRFRLRYRWNSQYVSVLTPKPIQVMVTPSLKAIPFSVDPEAVEQAQAQAKATGGNRPWTMR